MPRLSKWDDFDVDALEGRPSRKLSLAHSKPASVRRNQGFTEIVPVAGLSALLRKASLSVDIAARYPEGWHNWSNADIELLRNIVKKASHMRTSAMRATGMIRGIPS